MSHSPEDAEMYNSSGRVIKDRRWNTIGLSNVAVSAFIVGRWPQYYWIWHLIKSSILIPWRWIRFSQTNSELYLLDFCYFAGCYYVSIAAFLALLRTTFGFTTVLHAYNAQIIRIIFAYASGPLAWSILMFRNSLVLYDPDFTTSVWIHLSPALMMWTVRWGGGLGTVVMEESFPGLLVLCPDAQSPAHADSCMFDLWCESCPAEPYEFILYPLLFYVVLWAVPFYVIVLVGMRKYVEDNKKHTLFTYVKNGPFPGDIIRATPEMFQHLVYMLIHATSVLLFSGLGYIFWHSFWLHTAFIVTMILKAIHNGSHYIFRVFAMRYVKKIVKDQ